MKTLYFRYENYKWKSFEYNDISDLAEEFNKRNITIGYSANIGDYANIGNSTNIGDYANIGNSANIGDYANIGNYANIGDYANIGNGIKLITGFYINGSKDSITYVGNNELSIGCHTKKISWFKKNYKLLGKKEGYSIKEQNEYYQYILMAEKFIKIK